MQWRALGVALEAPREESVVDLEALIGLTAVVASADARIVEGALAWCGRHGGFVNSARLVRVVAEMRIEDRQMADFATAARRAGAPAWPMADSTERSTPADDRGRDLVSGLPRRDGARLLLVLRAAFGVNARADIAANLLVRHGSPTTVLELARAARFTKRNIAGALDDLVLSGVVERLGSPTLGRYRLRDPGSLLRWLDLTATAAYPDWVARYTVCLGVAAFTHLPTASARVRAVEAREVARSLLPSVERAALPGPDLRITGPAFATEFDRWTETLAIALGPGR